MSVKGLLEAEKAAKALQTKLAKSFNSQLKELKEEIKKVEFLLDDKTASRAWANSPADITRRQKLMSMLNETERLYLQAGNSKAAEIFKARMEKQLRGTLTNLKANELEVKLRVEASRAATEPQILSSLSDVKTEGALRELYSQSRSAGGFISGTGRGFMKDLVTLETKAAGSKTLGAYMADLYTRYETGLKDVFVKGIVRGDSYKQMQENLMRTTDITKGKARLLVRTEANAIFNESVRDVIDKNPLVKGYRFRAVLDSRTSKTCQEHDGKYIPKEDVKPGVNFPPLHPNCRSTVTTVLFNENERKDTVQRYTKNKSNEWVPVPPGMKYPEYKNMVLGNVSAVTARKVNIDNIPTLKNHSRLEKLVLEERAWKYKQEMPGVDVEKTVKKVLGNVVENSSFRIRVPDAEVLEMILDTKFKNQMETETSVTIVDPYSRKNISADLFGTDIHRAKDSDYEIYGYLGSKDVHLDYSMGYVEEYGDVIIELKKENLRDRTTFTMGDSIENSYEHSGRFIPSKVTDIKSTSLIEDNVVDLIDLAQRGGTEKLSPEMLADELGHSYIEAQYHGGVEVADIASVTFDTRTELPSDLFDKLKRKGIKVQVISEGTVKEIKAEQVFTDLMGDKED